MTKWKEQLDRELGMARKFHETLEQRILLQSNATKKRYFTYPITFIGACLVAVMLFLIGPTNTQNEHLVQGIKPSLKEFIQDESIDSFYVSYLFTEENHFLARANTLALGSKQFSSKDDIQAIMLLLRDTKTEKTTDNVSNIKGASKCFDMVLQFTNGEIRKIKVYDYGVEVGILDVETKIYYVADSYFSEKFIDLIRGDDDYFDFTVLYFLLIFLLYKFSIKFVAFSKKEKAPYTMPIAIIFFTTLVLTILAQGFNIVLSIWLPVGLLIVMALFQLAVVKRRYEDHASVRKLTINTILLVIMWAVVLFGQFWERL